MALLSNANLQAILDKLARYAGIAAGDADLGSFTGGFDAAALVALSGGSSLADFVLDLNDLDQVADLLPAAQALNEGHPAPAASIITQATGITAMLNALDAHYANTSAFATVNAYLTSINVPTPTLRAHGLFRRYYGRIAAANSFIPADLDLATFTVLTATTGTFADVGSIDTTKYGGAKLVAKNVGALTSTTGITVNATKLDGTTVNLTASIATLTDGFETNLSDTTMKFINVNSIAVTGATAGDDFKIVAKTDRSIAAA